ncbi:hypothetical protein CXG81DRAFT_26419 [Caulochytrium protostelioides]|uniref:Uncharacterized protein n=1 Tax=Caulochytrium protostelioides TaxID=1555241 RepID=A0A4P9X760_9FUNG|nr:hypothetical protein CXG81DRAFT_26419 [Caulochytrium protostelioides]|eukprot:RKP00880.1 hypothetical protein CXG81DRAFT_26419 [Caulochytrium protostelioides]
MAGERMIRVELLGWLYFYDLVRCNPPQPLCFVRRVVLGFWIGAFAFLTATITGNVTPTLVLGFLYTLLRSAGGAAAFRLHRSPSPLATSPLTHDRGGDELWYYLLIVWAGGRALPWWVRGLRDWLAVLGAFALTTAIYDPPVLPVPSGSALDTALNTVYALWLTALGFLIMRIERYKNHEIAVIHRGRPCGYMATDEQSFVALAYKAAPTVWGCLPERPAVCEHDGTHPDDPGHTDPLPRYRPPGVDIDPPENGGRPPEFPTAGFSREEYELLRQQRRVFGLDRDRGDPSSPPPPPPPPPPPLATSLQQEVLFMDDALSVASDHSSELGESIPLSRAMAQHAASPRDPSAMPPLPRPSPSPSPSPPPRESSPQGRRGGPREAAPPADTDDGATHGPLRSPHALTATPLSPPPPFTELHATSGAAGPLAADGVADGSAIGLAEGSPAPSPSLAVAAAAVPAQLSAAAGPPDV